LSTKINDDRCGQSNQRVFLAGKCKIGASQLWKLAPFGEQLQVARLTSRIELSVVACGVLQICFCCVSETARDG